MKVLVVGGGGREDALAWRLSNDPSVERVYCCPGNAGSARWGENIPGDAMTAASMVRPDLVVVGPEVPLAEGLGDRLRAGGFHVFGPGAAGARIESSKVYAKDLMNRTGIPTARAAMISSIEEAAAVLPSWPHRKIVIKADGLAAGKGVVIAEGAEEIRRTFTSIFIDKAFGAAGRRVLLEEFLEGIEASVLAITDGERYFLLPSAEDHKAVFDGDRGPNTGGMGAISPAPAVTPQVLRSVEEEILRPLLGALREEGLFGDASYRGVIYMGLMICEDGPRVIEFNCRFGDPETQAILPLVEGDLAAALLSAAEGRLDAGGLCVGDGCATCVVMTSGGYPGEYRKGVPIEGLELSAYPNGRLLFVSGAEQSEDRLITSGGRVLSVVGKGATPDESIQRAYASMTGIQFDGEHHRTDIGRRRIAR